ncbi:hypothetical protein ACIPYQ_31485 [Streptomyces sp. NPDC090045]|uniref:hypothetical protein n=1 Tax=Streptomyces sp. NPDC090045 TaxID=3365927 RepID=UPI0037F4F880
MRIFSARWVRGGLALACGGVLVACGGPAEGGKPGPAASGGSSASPSGAAPSGKPAEPSQGAHDRLAGRGPVLDVKGAKYRHSVRIVDAVVSPNTSEEPAPSGLTYIQLVLRVTGEPGRQLKAPNPKHWVVEFDGCRAAREKNSQVSCGLMDGGSPYYARADMESDEFGPGVDSMFGTLEADTAYWLRAWQLIPENADLTQATFCEVGPPSSRVNDNCIPVGEVRTGNPALPGSG